MLTPDRLRSYDLRVGAIIFLAVVIAVVGLAVFSLWRMARNNVEMIPGGSVGRQLSDVFRRRRKDDADA
jgi:hypothetical protein